jgi:hypothetical protein
MLNVTLEQIKSAGFQEINGPNAWHYPEGVNQGPGVPRIHIGGSIDHSPPPSMNVTFVSIGIHGRGRNLFFNRNTQLWDLDTPNVDWFGFKGELSGILTTLGIAK